MNNRRIYIAGHKGMVGSAICRMLEKDSSIELITRTRSALNLGNQADVQNFFQTTPVDEVYLAAARVGGIHANSKYPAEFIYENLLIEANIIQSAHKADVQKILFLGSSCIYPKFADQPIAEAALLTGVLESTNEPYAIAKIAGIKMCEAYNRQYDRDYRSIMPTNLYGPGDNYHSENSHVIPGLIARFHNAKINNHPSVEAWGTGSPKREFLFVDDMAAAAVFVMELDKEKYEASTSSMLSHINIGSGVEITIRRLTEMIAGTIGYQGGIIWDSSKPDGTPRKLMNSSKINELGWAPIIDLKKGLELAYKSYLDALEAG